MLMNSGSVLFTTNALIINSITFSLVLHTAFSMWTTFRRVTGTVFLFPAGYYISIHACQPFRVKILTTPDVVPSFR